MFFAVHIGIVGMLVFFIRYKVVMPMRMCDDMGVCNAIMGVNDGMGVSVNMVFVHGIIYNKNGANQHKNESNKEDWRQLFPKNQERQECSYKWCCCIISTCFCCSQITLCADIQKDAQSVGDKSENHCIGNVLEGWQLFSYNQRDSKRTCARKQSL